MAKFTNLRGKAIRYASSGSIEELRQCVSSATRLIGDAIKNGIIPEKEKQWMTDQLAYHIFHSLANE